MLASHTALFKKEIVTWCQSHSYTRIIDATCGEGGHTVELARSGLEVYAYEYDSEILKVAKERTKEYSSRIHFFNENFSLMHQQVDAVLLDIGISMWHYKKSGRGFSIDSPSEPLDMRSDSTAPISAQEFVRSTQSAELADVLERYGEVIHAPMIAKKLHERAQTHMNVNDVVSISGDQSRKVLQALRIVVNNEIESLKLGLSAAQKCARDAVMIITFHSIEDRIVKKHFAGWHLSMHKKQREHRFATSAQLRIYTHA